MNDIKREFDRINQKIQEWQGKLKLLQEKCPHENVEKDHGYYGDYDRVYWVRIKCDVCGYFKFFRSDVDPVEYRRWC